MLSEKITSNGEEFRLNSIEEIRDEIVEDKENREKLTSNGEEFRLNSTKEIIKKIVEDKENREKICKKLKRGNHVTEALSYIFITISIGLSGSGVGTMSFPPLAIGLIGAAAPSAFLGIVSNFISKKNKFTS